MRSVRPTEDSPHVAIVGAGPIGLDAALAARRAGMPFTLYEAADRVGAHVSQWGHVRLFSPWRFNLSERMREALGDRFAGADADHPTGAEYTRAVLEPLAEMLRTTMGAPLRTGCRLLAVSRNGLVKSDEIGTGARGRRPFRLLFAGKDGREFVEHAHIVLDCTGTYGQPNALGDGGIPAPGERALASRIARYIPDLDTDDTWAGKRILLVGCGPLRAECRAGLRDSGAHSPEHSGRVDRAEVRAGVRSLCG